jgi:hypothetical protein
MVFNSPFLSGEATSVEEEQLCQAFKCRIVQMQQQYDLMKRMVACRRKSKCSKTEKEETKNIPPHSSLCKNRKHNLAMKYL